MAIILLVVISESSLFPRIVSFYVVDGQFCVSVELYVLLCGRYLVCLCRGRTVCDVSLVVEMMFFRK